MKPEEQQIVSQALCIMERQINEQPEKITFSSSTIAKEYVGKLMKLAMQDLEHEEFHVIFLNAKHALIYGKTLFRGTVDQSVVYPREVAKEALAANASAVVLVHNHPSGCSKPSAADVQITKRLEEALGLLDIRVLDHFIIGNDITSMAVEGLI